MQRLILSIVNNFFDRLNISIEKMEKYMYIICILFNPNNCLFRRLANCVLLFCSDSDLITFPTLLADIKRPILKSAQGPRGVDI